MLSFNTHNLLLPLTLLLAVIAATPTPGWDDQTAMEASPDIQCSPARSIPDADTALADCVNIADNLIRTSPGGLTPVINLNWYSPSKHSSPRKPAHAVPAKWVSGRCQIRLFWRPSVPIPDAPISASKNVISAIAKAIVTKCLIKEKGVGGEYHIILRSRTVGVWDHTAIGIEVQTLRDHKDPTFVDTLVKLIGNRRSGSPTWLFDLVVIAGTFLGTAGAPVHTEL